MPDSSALAYNYDLGRANHKRDQIHFQVQFAVVGNGINLVKHAEFLFRFFFDDFDNQSLDYVILIIGLAQVAIGILSQSVIPFQVRSHVR